MHDKIDTSASLKKIQIEKLPEILTTLTKKLSELPMTSNDNKTCNERATISWTKIIKIKIIDTTKKN